MANEIYKLKYASELVKVGLSAIVILCIYNATKGKALILIVLAFITMLIAGYPLAKWLKDPAREDIPLFPMHAFFYLYTFGLATFYEYSGFSWLSEDSYTYALTNTIIGLVGLYVGYYYYSKKISFNKIINIKNNIYRMKSGDALFIYIISTIILNIVNGGSDGPSGLIQILLPIKIFTFYFLAYNYFKGELNSNILKIIFIFLVVPYYIVIDTGLLSGKIAGFGINSIALGFLYISIARKIPYKLIVFLLIFFSIFQLVKGEFRLITWGSEINYSLSDKIEIFAELIVNKFTNDNVLSEDNTQSVTSRVNNLVTTAAILSDTPKSIPYIYGSSYLPLFTKFIPRFIWNNKPTETFGNLWAQKYGYLSSESDDSTSYNVPWLPEMYMNFGIFGVFSINILVGLLLFILTKVYCFRITSASNSGFSMVLFTTLIVPESNLSLMIGGVIVSLISIYIIFYIKYKIGYK